MAEVSTVADLIRDRFGVGVGIRTNPEGGTVSIVARQILKADPRRLAFIIYNLTANALYIGPFPDVSTTRGFQVGIGGGSLNLLWGEDFLLPTLDWWGTSAVDDSEVLIQEILMTG